MKHRPIYVRAAKLCRRSSSSRRREKQFLTLRILTNAGYTVKYSPVSRKHGFECGWMAERSKATDCKSVGESLRWFEPNSNHHFLSPNALTASHRGAVLAQQVEHIHGKDGVPGPNPGDGSSNFKDSRDCRNPFFMPISHIHPNQFGFPSTLHFFWLIYFCLYFRGKYHRMQIDILCHGTWKSFSEGKNMRQGKTTA